MKHMLKQNFLVFLLILGLLLPAGIGQASWNTHTWGTHTILYFSDFHLLEMIYA